MVSAAAAFSGFSVDDLKAAKKFYGETLGLPVEDDPMGLKLKVGGGNPIYVYQKDDHQPATYTMLNFEVDDIDATVAELGKKGIIFEAYDLGGGAKTDAQGIMRGKAAKMGPDIAWFKDLAGNTMAVLED